MELLGYMSDMSLTSTTYRQKDRNLGKVIIWHKICFIGTELLRWQLMIYFTIDNIFYKKQVSGGPFAGRHFWLTSLPNTHWSNDLRTCSTKTHSTQLSRRLPLPVPVPCRHRLPIFIKQTFWDRKKHTTVNKWHYWVT